MVLQRRETRISLDDGRFERAFSMKIWQLKIPTKVEIFAWKTCSYILHVRSSLIDERWKMFALLKVLLSMLYQLWGNVLHFVLRPFSSLIIRNQRTSGGKMSQVILKPYAL